MLYQRRIARESPRDQPMHDQLRSVIHDFLLQRTVHTVIVCLRAEDLNCVRILFGAHLKNSGPIG